MMASTARELGQKLNAVQADKATLDMERRNAQTYARNQKAQRLVRRLEEIDGSIASLLSQAAESLDTLISASNPAVGTSSLRSNSNSADQLAVFESRAQDWYATLNEVQLGLRSAVKNLRKVQRAPVAFEASSSSRRANAAAAAQMGSAARGHSYGVLLSSSDGNATPTSAQSDRRRSRSRSGSPFGDDDDDDEKGLWRVVGRQSDAQTARVHDLGRNPTGSLLGAFVDTDATSSGIMQMRRSELHPTSTEETKLSLSALRQQERSWHHLSEALAAMAASRSNSDELISPSRRSSIDDRLSDRTISSPPASLQQQHSQQRSIVTSQRQSTSYRLAADTHLHNTADARLINAMLRMHVEVVPETNVAPIVAATTSV